MGRHPLLPPCRDKYCLMKTIKLIYPQWQGGVIYRWLPEITDPAIASRGYYLGAQLLDFLAPDNGLPAYTIPVATEAGERTVTNGITDRDAILLQTRAALDTLAVAAPDRIVTLGGECSVSVVPFTCLARRYGGDVAVIWIDAHPDITLPGDAYTGYHAMAVTACMGLGDEALTAMLPARIPPQNILYVGLRDWERDEIKARHAQYGMDYLTPQAVSENSDGIYHWLNTACRASRVMIHLDLDVLDPAEIIAAVGVVPGGMKIAEVVRVINDIARHREIVALTVAEHMPRTAIRIREMLAQLPLLR